jgi:methionyl-tRNA formyltransferase
MVNPEPEYLRYSTTLQRHKMTCGILASGGLGATCLEMIQQTSTVGFVMTDNGSDSILAFCKQNNIPIFIGNPRKGKAVEFIANKPVDVLLSINYLFIVEQEIINHPAKYAINFHGSLLPRYRGRTPHVWAIINNEKETGITAHLITEGCDEGDIVYQEKITIEPEFTGAQILDEFNKRYPKIIQLVMDMIENNTIKPIQQDCTKATWFGKRTPDDGRICWGWHKERIYNWVRAQAKPYPGAFSYRGNDKITIHQVTFSDYGFNADMPDGLILTTNPHLIVKTPNGAVALTNVMLPEYVVLKQGEILT